jgi:ABC-type multidrug transport system permease subunit
VLQVKKFASFAASNVVESASSTAMGMAVGAVAPSTEAALVIGPAVMLVFIVFGGLYTNPDDMPKWLKFLPNTSQIKTGCAPLA